MELCTFNLQLHADRISLQLHSTSVFLFTLRDKIWRLCGLKKANEGAVRLSYEVIFSSKYISGVFHSVFTSPSMLLFSPTASITITCKLISMQIMWCHLATFTAVRRDFPYWGVSNIDGNQSVLCNTGKNKTLLLRRRHSADTAEKEFDAGIFSALKCIKTLRRHLKDWFYFSKV